MEQPNLGKRISEHRKAKGLTQEELSEQCKISVRTLQRIESGAVTPRAYTVRVIYATLKKDSSFSRLHFEYVKDLFNLKKNTMKKVSILIVFALAVGFGLFALCPDSKAQVDIKRYVEDNSRNIIWLRPKGLLGYGQYFRNDTLFLRAGKDLIKECNGNVYLNDQYAGYADEGDTVILNKTTLFKKAKLKFRQVEYQKILALKDNITFISPKHLPYNLSINIGDGGEMRWKPINDNIFVKNNRIILNNDNQLYLNDVYQGNVFANDTIILKPRGTLTIKNTNKIE